MEPFELPHLLGHWRWKRGWGSARLFSEEVRTQNAHHEPVRLILSLVITVFIPLRWAVCLTIMAALIMKLANCLLPTFCWLTTRDLKSRHKDVFFFVFCFFAPPSRVPSRKRRAKTFSAATVCLRTCQPFTEWSLCCVYSHEGCCAVISASLHLPDNSVSKICAPARQEPLFSLPKYKPQDRKRDFGGFRIAAKHIWIVFLLRVLCCRLS